MKLDFFLILFSFNFLICNICLLLFNKLEKKILILISYFSSHNQTLESVF
jgi:hypothetical protein